MLANFNYWYTARALVGICGVCAVILLIMAACQWDEPAEKPKPHFTLLMVAFFAIFMAVAFGFTSQPGVR